MTWLPTDNISENKGILNIAFQHISSQCHQCYETIWTTMSSVVRREHLWETLIISRSDKLAQHKHPTVIVKGKESESEMCVKDEWEDQREDLFTPLSTSLDKGSGVLSVSDDRIERMVAGLFDTLYRRWHPGLEKGLEWTDLCTAHMPSHTHTLHITISGSGLLSCLLCLRAVPFFYSQG